MKRFPPELESVLEVQVGKLLSRAEQVPVVIESEMSVTRAAGVLAKHGISSAPIRTASGSFVGMFDFADLAELLLRGMRSKSGTNELDTVLEEGLSMTSPVRLVSDLSKRNPMISIKSTDSAALAVSTLLDKGLHRLCVVDDAGTFVGMLSFSDILRLLQDHGSLLSSTVAALGLVDKKPVCVGGDRPVLEALQLMVDNKTSSVAVTDETDGSLLTAITLTDCKNLVKFKRIDRMRLDCREFAAQIRAKQALEDTHGRESFPFFAVHPDTTLKNVVAKLVAVRAHRLFVLDQTKPVAVIEIPDIFAALVVP